MRLEEVLKEEEQEKILKGMLKLSAVKLGLGHCFNACHRPEEYVTRGEELRP